MRMNVVSILSDEYLEKMGNFYTSELCAKVYPEIKNLSFYEWLQIELRKKGMVLI